MENDLLFPLSYLVGEKVERKGEEERKPIVYPKTGRTTTTSTDPHAASIQDIRKRCESLDVLPSKQLSTLSTQERVRKSSLDYFHYQPKIKGKTLVL